MSKSNMSLSKKTALSFLAIFVMFGVGMGEAIYSYENLMGDITDIIKKDLELKDSLRQASKSIAEQISYEKEYLISKDSSVVERFNELGNKNKALIDGLKDVNVHYSNEIEWEKMEKSYFSYINNLDSVIELNKLEGDSSFGLRSEMRSHAHKIEEKIKKYNLGDSFMVSLLTLRRHEKDFLLRRDSKYVKRAEGEVKNIKSELIRRNFKEYIRDDVEQSVDSYMTSFRRLNDNQYKLNKHTQDAHELAKDTVAQIEDIISFVDKRTDEKLASSADEEEWVFAMLGGLFGVITLFSFGFQYNFSKSIKKIIDLSEKLRESAQVTEKSSANMSMASTKVSSSVTQQASAIQETVATLNEITAMVNKSVENARASSEKAGESQLVAQEGKRAVNDMVEAIGQINGNNEDIMKEMTRSNDEIVKIVDVINEISQKTNVINDIVFQTKLLSFNASVEAARAGEHGKGFAVVAEEVGNLAQMSGDAAREIEELLGGSIKKVQSIVDDTQKNVSGLITNAKSSIDKGVDVSENCGKILDSVVINVEAVTKMMHEISTASEEQAEGINNITDAMNELDEVTHSNTSIAQETSGFAESLTEQTTVLNKIVEDLESEVLGKVQEVVSKDTLLDSIATPVPTITQTITTTEDHFPSFDSNETPVAVVEPEFDQPADVVSDEVVSEDVKIADPVVEVSPDEYPSEDDDRFDKVV